MRDLVSALLILAGAGVLFLALLRTQAVLRLLTGDRHSRIWRALVLLMAFFLLGYLGAVAGLLTGLQALIQLLTGVVFLFGALFVLLVVHSGHDTILDLKEKTEAAEAASRAKSTFLANMSHELRTPLNAIIGYSEMLHEEARKTGQDDFLPDLEKIQSAGRHLLGLINDILDLSKIEAGKMELYLENFQVDAMLQDVINTVQPLVAKNANQLVIEKSEHLGEMRADLTKLRQALFNLLSNASKFTENGTITLAAIRERGGRDRLAHLPGSGYGHWHDPGATGPALSGLYPGRCLDHSQVWRHRPGADNQPALLPDDGRRHLRDQRVRPGLYLYHPAAGPGGRSPARRGSGGQRGRRDGGRSGRGGAGH